MPSRYATISPAQTARRIDTMRDTVTLEAVLDIYHRLSIDAFNDTHEDLASEAEAATGTLRELIAAGAPRGLNDSARDIHAIDRMIDTAVVLRDDTANAYGRYFHHTKQATEALEILVAYGTLIEAADADLRTGLTAA